MDNPVLRQVLLGCYDEGSPLRHLRNQRGMLELIIARIVTAWEAHIDPSTRGFLRLGRRRDAPSHCIPGRMPRRIPFPAPWQDTTNTFHINMMPFVMGDMTSLPQSCQRYEDMIKACLTCDSNDELGKVGYLTIHEGIVEAGTSQRRGGLHIEAGGGGGVTHRTEDYHWGMGRFQQNLIYGGIYMASSVANSCAIYDTVIDDPGNVVGALGDIEHLRATLAKKDLRPSTLAANEIVWMTDRTPHESLPLPDTTFRQYFRLVTSGVSHWYADHSTPNPLGIPPTATIVRGNKFQDDVEASKAPWTAL